MVAALSGRDHLKNVLLPNKHSIWLTLCSFPANVEFRQLLDCRDLLNDLDASKVWDHLA